MKPKSSLFEIHFDSAGLLPAQEMKPRLAFASVHPSKSKRKAGWRRQKLISRVYDSTFPALHVAALTKRTVWLGFRFKTISCMP